MGADLRYDMGTPGGSLVGRWAPDLVLHPDTGAVRLAEATRTARPLLVTAPDGSTPTALLLRPDCYVAWASTADAPVPDEQRDALTRWLGPVSGLLARQRASGKGPKGSLRVREGAGRRPGD